VPHNDDPSVTREPLIDPDSGYVRRSLDQMPKRGSKEPWRLRQNYAVDVVNLRHGKLEDGALRFTRRGEAAGSAAAAGERTVAA
ncbi:MAG: FAD-containing monooxygenase EthA, partial [Solirubrobacterales bacterium]